MKRSAIEKCIATLQSVLKLSREQASVILPLYLGGHMTVGAISLMTGAKTSQVERALEELMERGLVVKIDGVVPLYRAVPLTLAAVSDVSSVSEKTRELKLGISSRTQSQLEQIALVAEEASKLRHGLINQVGTDIDSYGSSVVALVSDKLMTITSDVERTLAGLSKRIAELLADAEKSLDLITEQNIASLQFELDNVHRRLQSEMNTISSEFNKWLQTEQSTAVESVRSFDTVSAQLTKSVIESITRALSDSSKVIRETLDELTGRLTSESSEVVQKSIATLQHLNKELTKSVTRIQASITEVQSSAQSSLSDSLAQTDEAYKEQSTAVQNTIASAAERVRVVQSDLDSWHRDVIQRLDTTLQSLTGQMQAVLDLHQLYHDKIRATSSSHVEALKGHIQGEYEYLMGLITAVLTDLNDFIAETKRSVLSLLESDIESEISRLSELLTELHNHLDKWSKSTSKAVTKHITEVSAELTEMLDTEAKEIYSVAENLRSRLQSSFNGLLSTNMARNESTLAELVKMIEDLKTSSSSEFGSLLSEYMETVGANIRETQSDFSSTASRLDSLIAQSIDRLGQQAEAVQQSVASAVSEKMAEIERQQGRIIENFQSYVDELTNQFLVFARQMKESFTSLVSSQALETRDLIVSTQNEFKKTVQSEIESLSSLSNSIRQDFDHALTRRVEELSVLVNNTQRLLEQFTAKKQSEIEETLSEIVTRIDLFMKGVQSSLTEMGASTVKQLGDDFVTVAQESGEAVHSMANAVAMKLDVAANSTSTALNKSATSMKSLVKTTVSERTDNLRSLITEAQRQLDALSDDMAKSITERTEAHKSEATARETESIRTCASSLDKIDSELMSHKAELSEGINTTTVALRSTVAGLLTALQGLVKQLYDRLEAMQTDLVRFSTEAGSDILEIGENALATVRDVMDTSFSSLSSSVSAILHDMGQQSRAELESMISQISQLSKTIATLVSEIISASVSSAESKTAVLLEQMANELKGIRSSAKSAEESLTRLIEQLGSRALESSDNLLEKARNAFLECTISIGHAEEAVGAEFKHRVDHDLRKFIDKLETDFDVQRNQLRSTTASTINTVSESISKTRQSCDESLHNFDAAVDQSLQKLISDIGTTYNTLRDDFDGIITESGGLLDSLAKALHSLNEAAKELSGVPAEDTWYVSGRDEIASYVMDMVMRAEESIVISVPDLSIIDLDRLSSVKQPRRRVIVVPTTEEPVPALDGLSGWRVWREKTPPLLVVRDGVEIVIGASEGLDKSIALVSVAPGYLRLFHDLLGPMLTRMRTV